MKDQVTESQRVNLLPLKLGEDLPVTPSVLRLSSRRSSGFS